MIHQIYFVQSAFLLLGPPGTYLALGDLFAAVDTTLFVLTVAHTNITTLGF